MFTLSPRTLASTMTVAGLVLMTAANPALAENRRSLPLKALVMDGVHVAENGDIYTAEGFSGDRLFIITPEGNTFFITDALEGPIDATTDSLGNVFVTNFNSASVSKVSPAGEVTHFADTLPFPAGITIDDQDNLYVSQFGESDPQTGLGQGTAVQKITPDGVVSTFSEGGALLAPVGITLGDDGILYTANFHDGTIIAIDQEGQQTVITQVERPGFFATIGHLEFVNGLLYATGVQGAELLRVNPSTGQTVSRDLSRDIEFPNGVGFDQASGTLLISEAFVQLSRLLKVRVANPAD
ncbi:MAG: hypothetical protein AAF184_18825 [Pseudomonadota bacterium]